MKSLMRLLQEILLDRGIWCNTSTTLDYKLIERRVEHEGLSFLTITLPTFGADLQRALSDCKVDRHLFQGFSWKGGLPQFLGGFLDLVFDRSTGLLLEIPDTDAIQAIRQITLMFAKINLPCSKEREDAAISRFLQCEKDVKTSDMRISAREIEQFTRVSRLLWSDVLLEMDRKIYFGELVPKHGPGSTADGLLGNEKFNQLEWTERLEYLFPHGEYLAPSWRYFQDLHRVNILEPGQERPVKVTLVPKTLKTPRIIAIEPTCMQYMQQAILEQLVFLLGRLDTRPSWILGFDDQIPNQKMALEGSLFEGLATLDLSDASDRVSNQLVRALTAPYPNLFEGIDATRSRKADVPGKGVIRLSKYASMGSALCFPVEAMVFATLVFCGIEDTLSKRLTAKQVESFRGKVRIYGDDIIVPVDSVAWVITKLEAFGLRVNSDKSYWTGRFRESCGKEYYHGIDVSVVKVREMFPTKPGDVPELVSLVSLRNQLYKAGYWKVTAFLDGEIRKLIPFPTVLESSSVLGRHSFWSYDSERMCPKLHTPLVRGHVIRCTAPINKLEGYGALLKFFLKRGSDPFLDKKHLERSGRPRSVSTKPRWAQPF